MKHYENKYTGGEMRKRYFFLLTAYCLLLVLAGCGGGGPGSPGSSGSEDTGIRINSVTITTDSPDLDANIHLCPPDFTEAEPGLFRDDATITINASRLNPNSDFDPFPSSVEECTITYLKSNDDPSSPTIEAWTVFPNCTINEGSNSCLVNLIDIQRKVDFFDDVVSGRNTPDKIPTRYAAKYDCIMKNNLGKKQSFQIELEIFLADFDLCG